MVLELMKVSMAWQAEREVKEKIAGRQKDLISLANQFRSIPRQVGVIHPDEPSVVIPASEAEKIPTRSGKVYSGGVFRIFRESASPKASGNKKACAQLAMESAATIIDLLWSDAKADYDAASEQGKANHLFVHLIILRKWLKNDSIQAADWKRVLPVHPIAAPEPVTAAEPALGDKVA
jgi:hypothetical protein